MTTLSDVPKISDGQLADMIVEIGRYQEIGILSDGFVRDLTRDVASNFGGSHSQFIDLVIKTVLMEAARRFCWFVERETEKGDYDTH